MKTYCKRFGTALLLGLSATIAAATETDSTKTKGEMNLSVDLTTTTLWRGSCLGGFAVQPSFGYSIAGVTASVWGSTDFNGSRDGYTELDFSLSYEIAGVNLALTDYCWTNADGKLDYFGKYEKNHFLEMGVGFDFGEYFEKAPVTLGVNTMLYGANKTANGDGAFSTFFTLDYSCELKNLITLGVGAGAALEFNGARLYANRDGFSVTDIHLSASREFNIRGKCAIGVSAAVMYNPAAAKIYAVAGVGFSI